jgi:hypothetical protein
MLSPGIIGHSELVPPTEVPRVPFKSAQLAIRMVGQTSIGNAEWSVPALNRVPTKEIGHQEPITERKVPRVRFEQANIKVGLASGEKC